MENVNFERWLMDNYLIEEDLEYYIRYLYPYKEYLPNLEAFIMWFAKEGGLLDLLYLEKIDKNNFIDEFENKINEYNQFEKYLYIKILLQIIDFHNRIYERNFEGVSERTMTEEEIKEYLGEWDMWSGMSFYFDLQAKKLNKNLPFSVVDKSKTIVNLDDPYPKVGWTIEENPNYIKETTTKENIKPQQITPIKLELNQSQIIYLFDLLMGSGYLDMERENPNLWSLISQYFVDENNKPVGNGSQIRENYQRNKNNRPKKVDNIERIVLKDLENFED